MAKNNIERELKFRVKTFTSIKAYLTQIKAELLGKHFERNLVFDIDGILKENDLLLRLRIINGKEGVMTSKGPKIESAKAKQREEEETIVPHPEEMIKVLKLAGFEVIFEYEKMRTEFKYNGMIVCLDELPVIGKFVEIEFKKGYQVQAEALAKRVAGENVIFETSSYPGLAREHFKNLGREVEDLKF